VVFKRLYFDLFHQMSHYLVSQIIVCLFLIFNLCLNLLFRVCLSNYRLRGILRIFHMSFLLLWGFHYDFRGNICVLIYQNSITLLGVCSGSWAGYHDLDLRLLLLFLKRGFLLLISGFLFEIEYLAFFLNYLPSLLLNLLFV
jgi:hypothetical protein